MSEPETSTAEILVHLVRPGIEARDFHLSEGSTVADLLRASGISTTNQTILVDGVPIEEAVTLNEGVVITIAPPAGKTGGDERWGSPIAAFQDEELCREYWEALEAGRRDAVGYENS